MASPRAILNSPGNRDEVKLVPAKLLVERAKDIHDLIECRAYEIFERRGCAHGSDLADWHWAESEVLCPCHHELQDLPEVLVLKAEMPGSFTAAELELSVEPRRLIVSGERSVQGIYGDPEGTHADAMPERIFRVHDLPAEIDPGRTAATLRGNVLTIVMPKVAVRGDGTGREPGL